MKNTQLQRIKTETLEKIRQALEIKFSKELNVQDFYGNAQTTWSIPEIGLTYKSTDSSTELLKFVETLTNTENVRQAYAKIYEEIDSRKGNENKDRPTQPDRTVISEKTDEGIFKDLEERNRKSSEAIKNQKEAVAKFKEAEGKRYQDQQKADVLKEKQAQDLLAQFFKSKVVVVPTEEIPEVKLSKEKKETLIAVETAAKEDPATTKKIFEEKIQVALKNSEQKYKDSITKETIEKSAVHLVETLRNLPNHKNIDEISDTPRSLNTLSILNPLTNPNSEEMKRIIPNKAAREKFTREVQTLMLATEAERIVNLAGAKAILGEDLAYSLCGTDTITDFKISSDEKDRDEGVEIDPQAVYEKGKQVYDFINKVRQAKSAEEVTSTALAYYPSYSYSGASVTTKTVATLTKALPAAGAVYGFRQGTLLAHWAKSGTPLLSAGNQNLVRLLTSQASVQEIASASLVTFSRPIIAFESGGVKVLLVTGTNKALGTQIAVGGVKFGQKMAGAIAVKGGTQIAVVTGTQAGAQLAVGTSTVLTKVLTFLGGLSTPVTAGIGLIIGYLAGKVIEKLPRIKKWFQENGPVLAGVAGLGGLVLGGPVVGGLVLFGGLATTGSLAAFATGAFGVLGLIGRSVGIAIATPVIVTLLVLPPLVAFIMLVINNSAYVVPPSPYETGGGGYTPEKCLGDPPEKPVATNIKYSSDGKYAYPTAPFEVPGYACYHWDGNKAADIFSPQDKPPMVAYESGTISNVTLNDSLGGKYIILKGQSGRYYYYAHLCHVFVDSGQTVGVGDVIATMDETGSGRVQHLHYAINEPPLTDTFIGGDGNVCPQEDFEEKFGFGVCNASNYCVNP